MNARKQNWWTHHQGGTLDFEKEFNITDCKASEGRLDRWKIRHNVAFATVSGEGRSFAEEMTAS